jgi:hypothetical protein
MRILAPVEVVPQAFNYATEDALLIKLKRQGDISQS